MSRIWGSALIVFSTAVVVSAAAPACADNDESIFIQGMMAPPTARTTSGCTYIADPTASRLLGSGVMDTALANGYTGVLLVGNQLIPRGDPSNTRAESNRVHIQGAIVSVQNPDGSSVAEFTSTTANGLADPQNNNTPGYEIVAVTLIDKATRDALAGGLAAGASRRVEVHAKIFGRTVGGKDVESGDWSTPVEVCNGCLVDFSAGNDPAQQPSPNCKRASTATNGTQTGPCIFGQDERVPCTSCLANPACNPGP